MDAAHAALLAAIEAETRATAHWTHRETLNRSVLAAVGRVRRDAFVPPSRKAAAYEDAPLPIGHGQTISQPFIVALMTDLLDLRPGDRVLEIGSGSGYQAAVLAELVDDVCSVEVIPALAERAAAALAEQGYGKVALRVGDGSVGWPERAPFDAIIVTAAGPDIPPALVVQLAPGGRLVLPVGPLDGDQELLLVRKHDDGSVARRVVLLVAFVPLTHGRPN